MNSVLASFTAAPLESSLASVAQPQSLATGGGMSGYDAGNWSARRGYVYFPTLNTERELAPSVRAEIVRKTRWLTKNVGFARRCTHGLAQMVGSLAPRALTEDREWNRLAEAAYERRCGTGEGLAFDRSGRFNAYAIQPMLTACRMIDGDIGIALTESASGGAMVAVYESQQIRNGNGPGDPRNWRDGVFVVGDRRIAYRLADGSRPSGSVDIPARDFMLHARYVNFGHTRGEPPLTHAVTNLLDETEIRADVKSAIKVAGKAGYYIARELGAAAPKGAPRGMGVQPVTETTSRGEPVAVENIYRGGMVQELNPGEELKALIDQRPHPNSRDFLEDLNRDIAYGIGVSPDVLWNIAKLGGASVRFVLAEADAWIKAQHQLLIDQVLHRFWVYFIAKEIKAGRLRECQDPEWYWKLGWLPPSRLTVDIGRDGKLSIDLHRAGMLTLQRWYGEQGLDYEEELRQHVREYALKMKVVAEVSAAMGVTLDFDKVFPPAPGSPGAAGSIITPDMPGFSDPAGIEQVLVEIRDNIVNLRAA